MNPRASPIPFERLLEHAAGELDSAAADAVDEHVFACPSCEEALARITALGAALAAVPLPVFTPSDVARIRAGGVRVVATRVAPGVPLTVPFPPDVDLVVHGLQADLRAADRVDVAAFFADGSPLLAIDGVPFDPAAGEVIIACTREMFARNPSGAVRVRLRVVDAADRPVSDGEYDIRHAL